MLESVKEILISEKLHELQERRQIEKEISTLNKQEKQENFDELDKKLQEIENELIKLKRNKITSILNSGSIDYLNNEYRTIALTKIQKLEQYNNSRNNLLARLHVLCHDQALIEAEIKRIRNATTLEELNLTNEKALALLRKYHNHQETTSIQCEFLKILNENISTKEEIEAKLKYLYQTNRSAFYIEMNKTNPSDFSFQLIEIGIEIEKDKLEFLEKFFESSNTIMFSNVKEIQSDDELDIYFNSEVASLLNKLKKYPTMSSMALSQIMSLAALVSIAKQNSNKKEAKR